AEIRHFNRLIAGADRLLRKRADASPGHSIVDVYGSLAGANRVEKIGDDEPVSAAVTGHLGLLAFLGPVGMLVFLLVLFHVLPLMGGRAAFDEELVQAESGIVRAPGSLKGILPHAGRARGRGVVTDFDEPALLCADQRLIGVAVLKIDFRGGAVGA